MKKLVWIVSILIVIIAVWFSAVVRLPFGSWKTIDDLRAVSFSDGIYIFIQYGNQHRRLTIIQYFGSLLGIDPGVGSVDSHQELVVFSYRGGIGPCSAQSEMNARWIGPVMPYTDSQVAIAIGSIYLSWDGKILTPLSASISKQLDEQLSGQGSFKSLLAAGFQPVKESDLLLFKNEGLSVLSYNFHGTKIDVRFSARVPEGVKNPERIRGQRHIAFEMNGKQIFEVAE